MQYYVTIYIDILFEKDLLKLDVTHAFLGLTHIHPDKLDKIDSEIKMQNLKMLIGKILIKNGMKKYTPLLILMCLVMIVAMMRDSLVLAPQQLQSKC